MTEKEFDFLLQDRIMKIQAINEQYDLLNNAYLSFSGGKDSTVLHYLLDLALPGNNIPRLFINTGMEYLDMIKFVRTMAEQDNRIIIHNSGVNIPKMLEKYGYPFKSKDHSLRVNQFNKGSNSNYIKKYIEGWEHNGIKSRFCCSEKLLYQFEEKGKYNYSDQCCHKLKKDVAREWEKVNNRSIYITGMQKQEGGNEPRCNAWLLIEKKMV